MKTNDKHTRILVLTALMTALVLICTLLLRIPCGPDCYIHLGDAAIFLAVMILPRKHACFAGSVGASLADLIGGFAFWAPWTFFVKLLMVLVFGAFLDKVNKHNIKVDTNHASISDTATENKKIAGLPRGEFIGLVLACIVAVAGYFVSEMILFGQWVGALACVGFNTVQVAVDAVVAELVSRTLYTSTIRDIMNYRRPQ